MSSILAKQKGVPSISDDEFNGFSICIFLTTTNSRFLVSRYDPKDSPSEPESEFEAESEPSQERESKKRKNSSTKRFVSSTSHGGIFTVPPSSLNPSSSDPYRVAEVDLYLGSAFERVLQLARAELEEINTSIGELQEGKSPSPAILAAIAAFPGPDTPVAAEPVVLQKRKRASHTMLFITSLSRRYSC